jgi:hypothetical protein
MGIQVYMVALEGLSASAEVSDLAVVGDEDGMVEAVAVLLTGGN